MSEEREDLIDELREALGFLPPNTRLILSAIVHPAVIDFTKRYIRVSDVATLCVKYKAPWDCIKEAEAKFENIKFGWLGAASELGMDWICENCRKRITED